MRSVVLAFLLAAGSVAPLHAQLDPVEPPPAAAAAPSGPAAIGPRWSVSASGGWTGAGVGILKRSVNTAMEMDEYVWDILVPVSTVPFTSSVEADSGGMAFMGEVDYRLGRVWGLGLRGGALSGPTVRGTGQARSAAGDYFNYDGTYDCSMNWFGLGGWGELGKGKIKGRGFLFVGPAFCKVSVRQSASWYYTNPGAYTIINMYTGVTANPYSTDIQVDMTGSSTAFEIGADGSYEVARGLALFAGLSYRSSTFENLEYGNDVDVDGNGTVDIEAGNKESAGGMATPDYDFGGVNLQAGLRVSF
jgi:hypothetical protein